MAVSTNKKKIFITQTLSSGARALLTEGGGGAIDGFEEAAAQVGPDR